MIKYGYRKDVIADNVRALVEMGRPEPVARRVAHMLADQAKRQHDRRTDRKPGGKR